MTFVHMHVNRVLRSAHNHQEAVLYDYLGRHYRSMMAQSRSSFAPAAATL